MSWRDGIKVHPAADLFPMMSDVELDEMAADIAENGLRELPVWWHPPGNKRAKPQLLDGRNRYAAIDRITDPEIRARLQKAVDPNTGYLCRFITSDPYAYVLSANLHRRHLTPAQKREVIAKMLEADPRRSDRATAAIVKVSKNTVASVRAELEGRGQIDHVETRTDTKGRAQPARKAAQKPQSVAAPVSEPLFEPSPGLPEYPTTILFDQQVRWVEGAACGGNYPFDEGDIERFAVGGPSADDKIRFASLIARQHDLLFEAMKETPRDAWLEMFSCLQDEFDDVANWALDQEECDDPQALEPAP